jgi:hypothetical protein
LLRWKVQAKTYTTHLTPKLSHLSSPRGAPRGVRFGGPADCSLAPGPFPPHVSACHFAARRDRSYPFVAVRSVSPDLRNAPNISDLWAPVAKRHSQTCGVRPTTARAPSNHIMGEIGKTRFTLSFCDRGRYRETEHIAGIASAQAFRRTQPLVRIFSGYKMVSENVNGSASRAMKHARRLC